MRKEPDPSRLLRLALRANAVFSTVCGAAFLVASPAIAGFIGHDRPADLGATGFSLVLFAAGLFWLASRPEISRPGTWLAVALDVAWVLLTAGLLGAGWFNAAGKTAAVLVALVVADFALFQYLGLRRLTGRRHS